MSFQIFVPLRSFKSLSLKDQLVQAVEQSAQDSSIYNIVGIFPGQYRSQILVLVEIPPNSFVMSSSKKFRLMPFPWQYFVLRLDQASYGVACSSVKYFWAQNQEHISFFSSGFFPCLPNIYAEGDYCLGDFSKEVKSINELILAVLFRHFNASLNSDIRYYIIASPFRFFAHKLGLLPGILPPGHIKEDYKVNPDIFRFSSAMNALPSSDYSRVFKSFFDALQDQTPEFWLDPEFYKYSFYTKPFYRKGEFSNIFSTFFPGATVLDPIGKDNTTPQCLLWSDYSLVIPQQFSLLNPIDLAQRLQDVYTLTIHSLSDFRSIMPPTSSTVPYKFKELWGQALTRYNKTKDVSSWQILLAPPVKSRPRRNLIRT